MARIILGIPFECVVVGPSGSRVISGNPLEGFQDTDFSAPGTLDQARSIQWRPEARRIVHEYMVMAAAGPLAQMQYEGHPWPEDETEFYKFGGSDDVAWIRGYSLGLAATTVDGDEEIIAAAAQLVRAAIATARTHVERNEAAIGCVASALLDKGRLTETETRTLCEIEIDAVEG